MPYCNQVKYEDVDLRKGIALPSRRVDFVQWLVADMDYAFCGTGEEYMPMKIIGTSFGRGRLLDMRPDPGAPAETSVG